MPGGSGTCSRSLSAVIQGQASCLTGWVLTSAVGPPDRLGPQAFPHLPPRQARGALVGWTWGSDLGLSETSVASKPEGTEGFTLPGPFLIWQLWKWRHTQGSSPLQSATRGLLSICATFLPLIYLPQDQL